MPALGDAGARTSRLGRYELITRIGEGGMAEVQLALQRGPAGFEKLVVVKLVHESLATQKDFVDMLLDEARVAALLKHPNVVDIYDLGEADGRFFIAMEYLEGEPLLSVLRAGRDGKRLDMLSTGRLVADTAEGLDAAHELRSMAGDPLELVHHDVSLGNIVVLYNGQVKLVDFGVAKATQSVAPSRRVQGKFSYMAPEKLRGAAGDRRSDIWSLGCVLWEALTLKRLFKGGNDGDTMRQVLESEIPPPSHVNGEVPPAFDRIALRALERDPRRRYPTAKELSADLEEVLRARGYGGKNELIARYMQSTFAAHIEARKRLLQEVSSKGAPSAAVLEAAFDDPMLASGSRSTGGEFSVRFKASTADMSAPIRAATARRPDSTPPRPRGSEPPPIADTTEVSAPPIVVPFEDVMIPPTPVPGAGTTPVPGGLDAPPVAPEPTAQLRPARRDLVLALIGVAVVGAIAIAVVIALSGRDEVGGGGAAEPAAAAATAPATTPAAAPVTMPEPAPVPPPPPAPAPAPAPTTTSTTPPPTAEPGPAPAPVKPPPKIAPKDPAPPKIAAVTRPPVDPATHYKAAINAYVLGDTKGAIAAYKRALIANPNFAIAWRGLGLAHEKLGDTRAAAAAFQRYLQLAPEARDAATIRAKIGAK